MPIITLQQRVRECGRIRIGQKGAKGQPQKLSVFRLTSFDKRAIDAAAVLWGGSVVPCEDKDLKGQFEVVTEASEIPIMVGAAEPSQYMELWSGGGCKRRCDGNTELLSGKPCMCDPEDQECKPTTRLSVVLPDLPGLGVWRLESKGWNAAVELLQTYEFMRSLSGTQYAHAFLALEERVSRKDGKTHRFMVPVIRIPVTPRTLLGGRSMDAALGTGSDAPELPAPAGDASHVLHDPRPRAAVFATLRDMGLPGYEAHKDVYRLVFAKVLRVDAVESCSALDDAQWGQLAHWLHDVAEGTKKLPKVLDVLRKPEPTKAFDPMATDASAAPEASEPVPDEDDVFI